MIDRFKKIEYNASNIKNDVLIYNVPNNNYLNNINENKLKKYFTLDFTLLLIGAILVLLLVAFISSKAADGYECNTIYNKYETDKQYYKNNIDKSVNVNLNKYKNKDKVVADKVVTKTEDNSFLFWGFIEKSIGFILVVFQLIVQYLIMQEYKRRKKNKEII